MSEVAADFRQDDEDSSRKRDNALLDKHVNQLTEYFDSVTILVTRYDGPNKGTACRSRGVGDWYARYGVVRAWLKREDGELMDPKE